VTKKKILIVDDDEAVLAYLQAKLGARYDLVSTSAPGNVLGLARRERPDLILCDIDMPEMDGGDISAALFADSEARDIPVLFLSQLVSGAGQVGGRAAISKTAPIGDLIARIEALLPH
jgi:CheY-like chemotaxis protein